MAASDPYMEQFEGSTLVDSYSDFIINFFYIFFGFSQKILKFYRNYYIVWIACFPDQLIDIFDDRNA